MLKLENYIAGKWITGDGDGQPLFNAVTGEPVAAATSKGLDFKSMTDHARTVGNPALRKMTFHQRGNMLKALALHLRNHLDKFYKISYQTGATKADSWVDIEGGIGNLFANASLRRNSLMKFFVLMAIVITSVRTILLWERIFLFPKKAWLFISMHLIFLFGACWKKLQ
jgi:acyl-CoA reductase-like NAD-dependent aldehyde dehydrogenase